MIPDQIGNDIKRVGPEDMRIPELRQKSKEELEESLLEKRSRIDELRFLLRQKKIKNVKEMQGVKKDVARILTVMRNL